VFLWAMQEEGKEKTKKRTTCKCTLAEVVLLLSGRCHCSLPLHSSKPIIEFSRVYIFIFYEKNYICSLFNLFL